VTEEPQPHLLTSEELADLFANDVRPTLTASSQENPRLLILGGPQGSGKTTLRRVVAEQLALGDAVIYDGDDWYDFHPHYDGLAREHGGLEAMKQCGPDVRELTRMTLDHIRQNRQNLVLVGPYTAQELTFQRIQEFPDHRPEMAYIARHPALSQLGVVYRHHRATGPDGVGYSILPSLDLQEKVFAGVPEIMAEAERRGAVEALHVVDRSGVVFTKQRAPDGRWTPVTDIQEVVQSARHQPWSTEERDHFERQRAEVENTSGDQWRERLESIDRLAAPMLAPPREASTTPQSAESRHGLAPGQTRPSIADAARSRSTTGGKPPTGKGPAPQPGPSGGHHRDDPKKRPGRGR
jgi:hypothetical protein